MRIGWLALACLSAIPAHAENSKDRSADVRLLREEWLLKEQALSPADRIRAAQLIERFAANADNLSDAQFAVKAMRLTALANSGGSLVTWPTPDNQLPRLPVRLSWFEDGLLILRGTGDGRHLAGGRIERIDGQPVKALVERLRPLFGGAEARQSYRLPSAIEAPALLHAAGLADHPDRLTVDILLPDGRRQRQTLSVSSGTVGGAAWWPDRWAPDGFGNDSGWSYLRPDRVTPLYLRDFERPLRFEEVGDQAAYVQLKWTPQLDPAEAAKQIDAHAKKLRIQPLRRLIIDLRFDHGASGPETTNAFQRLIAGLGRKTEISLIVGRYTHGSGVKALADLAAARPGIRIVGEEPGDWLRGPLWGGRVCFATVGACATYSRSDEGPVSRRSFPFRIEQVPVTAEALLQARDPALERALGG